MEGTPFGRYRLVELVGRGGMGEVWRSFDTVTERVVAIKVLPSHLVDDQVFMERFRREAHAAAGISNPHVVPIHDFGEIEDRLYVDMRLIEGDDLQSLINRGPLEPARAVSIIDQVASALDAAHRIQLVHRDVKPSNILLADRDFAYLIDFGIARTAGDIGLTGTGATVGTFEYMAPERFRDGMADSRADIYALTCVLHQSLTGQLPYPAQSLGQLAHAHLSTPPPRPSALKAGIPPAMDNVIATGMAKEPDERYSTTMELAQAARAALNSHARQSVPSPVVAASTLANGQGQHAQATPFAIDQDNQAAVATSGELRLNGNGQRVETLAQPTLVPEPRTAEAPPPAPSTPDRRAGWRRRGVVITAASLIAAASAVTVWLIVARETPTEIQPEPISTTQSTPPSQQPGRTVPDQRETLPRPSTTLSPTPATTTPTAPAPTPAYTPTQTYTPTYTPPTTQAPAPTTPNLPNPPETPVVTVDGTPVPIVTQTAQMPPPPLVPLPPPPAVTEAGQPPPPPPPPPPLPPGF